MGNAERLHIYFGNIIIIYIGIKTRLSECRTFNRGRGKLTYDTLRGKTLRHQLKLQVPRAEIDKFITQIKGFREATTQRHAAAEIPRLVASRSGVKSVVHPAGMP